MNKEITLKELIPNEFYINDIGLMCCELSLNEVNNITSVLTNLQQENQQLKEENNITKEHHQEMVNYAYDLMLKRDKYKSVLDEIREYIEKCWFIEEGEKVVFQEDIEEILDKVKE